MPLVTAIPRGQSNGQVVTEFIDSVGTTSVTYSYTKAQEKLVLRNTGERAVTVTVGVLGQTIQPGDKGEFSTEFVNFSIVSTSGNQSFEAWADEKGASFDSPEGRYLGATATGLFIEKVSTTRFYVWVKQLGCRWLRYQIINSKTTDTSESTQDVWRIYTAEIGDISTYNPIDGGVSLTNVIAPFSLASQWEYAFQPSAAPDFMGGYHGDEMVQAVSWMFDGKPLDVRFIPRVIAVKRFEMVQKTALYNPTNHTTKLGDMYVRHIFTTEGLAVKWRMVWAAAETITSAYGGMLPALRGSTSSQTCRFVDEPTTYDISTATFPTTPVKNSYGIEMWNSTNKLTVGIEFTDTGFFNNYANTTGWGMWVTNSALYNKVYPSRVYSPTATASEAVTSGAVWQASFVYKLYMPE